MTTSTQVQTITWRGQSGAGYKYWIYPISAEFKAVAGNYIYARETKPGSYQPIYIGQTSNLAERPDNHHKMPCIKLNGATHIHVHTNSGGEVARLSEETDLVRKWNTVCNG